MAPNALFVNIAHDPITWRESRYFENFKFTFGTFAEVQAFAKEKLEDRSLPHSGGHYITVIPVADDGTTRPMMLFKYANWQHLATGKYSNVNK